MNTDDLKRLRDEAELKDVRARVLDDSVDAARERFVQISAEVDAAQRAFDEALIKLWPDEFDDEKTADEKATKLARTERELDQNVARWEHAFLRCGYEIAEAQRIIDGRELKISDAARDRMTAMIRRRSQP